MLLGVDQLKLQTKNQDKILLQRTIEPIIIITFVILFPYDQVSIHNSSPLVESFKTYQYLEMSNKRLKPGKCCFVSWVDSKMVMRSNITECCDLEER